MHRAIIHELRDIYRQERKRSAAKKSTGPVPVIPVAPRASEKREREEEEQNVEDVMTKLAKWYTLPASPLPPTPPPRTDSLKRKRAPALALKGKRASYSPPRGLGPRKRKILPLIDEDEDWPWDKRARIFGPSALKGEKRKARTRLRENPEKKQRRGYSPIEHAISGFKRGREDESDAWTDEEEEKRGRFGPDPVMVGVKRKRGKQLRRDDLKRRRFPSTLPTVGVKRKRYEIADDDSEEFMRPSKKLRETAASSDEELEKKGILEFLD